MVWIALASASTPVVAMDDGAVTGRIEVPATTEDVRGKLADPRWVAGVAGGVTVELVRQEGACGVYRNTSPTVFKTLTWTTRYCPTATGFRADLVEADGLDAYEAEWTVKPGEAGTTVGYRLVTVPSFSVPSFVADRMTRRAVESLLVKVGAAL
ncbi:MAG: SRPBCC family protein [Alphaproteobacteria bacterium]|nr:SRPBCC family protein [Alphaproteobacteria bacterium]